MKIGNCSVPLLGKEGIREVLLEKAFSTPQIYVKTFSLKK